MRVPYHIVTYLLALLCCNRLHVVECLFSYSVHESMNQGARCSSEPSDVHGERPVLAWSAAPFGMALWEKRKIVIDDGFLNNLRRFKPESFLVVVSSTGGSFSHCGAICLLSATKAHQRTVSKRSDERAATDPSRLAKRIGVRMCFLTFQQPRSVNTFHNPTALSLTQSKRMQCQHRVTRQDIALNNQAGEPNRLRMVCDGRDDVPRMSRIAKRTFVLTGSMVVVALSHHARPPK